MLNKTKLFNTISRLSVFFVLCTSPSGIARAEFSERAALPAVRYQEPEYLTFEELQDLSVNPRAEGPLKEKLDRLWHTPLISNEAHYGNPITPVSRHPVLGPFIRIATWNIEKSYNIPPAIELFTRPASNFASLLTPGAFETDSAEYKNLLRQRMRLVGADILILQEMEIGIKRSGYLNAAAEIAKALNMNYVYGIQYLEVDPVLLGMENITLEDGNRDEEAMEHYRVDPAKYKGMFGSAVLSRFPIKHVELRPLQEQPYDWYAGEVTKTGFLENSRRFGAKSVFQNEITRELKVGGRHYFRVDLDIPEIPGGTLTVINIHLEIKCQPQGRDAQMAEILSAIKEIKNPVIMAGDFNASHHDLSATSVTRVVKRTAKNPTTWLNAAVTVLTPYGLAINTTRTASNITKNFNDPFAADIKIVGPNALKQMFMRIKNFRFDDGGAFDFRGDKDRSINRKSKLLANSNERGRKGFKTTFQVRRPLGIVGKYRLDWCFVKSLLNEPEDRKGPYRLAPHFGETLEELNVSLRTPVSDHHPNVVDIPLEEPRIKILDSDAAVAAAAGLKQEG